MKKGINVARVLEFYSHAGTYFIVRVKSVAIQLLKQLCRRAGENSSCAVERMHEFPGMPCWIGNGIRGYWLAIAKKKLASNISLGRDRYQPRFKKKEKHFRKICRSRYLHMEWDITICDGEEERNLLKQCL